MKQRHPQGRTCREVLPLAVLLIPVAMVRALIYHLTRK